MNIELNRAECHVIKDLFPGMSSVNLSRWQVENIIDKVENHIFSLEIGETRSVCADAFHKIAVAIDGEEGKEYIEPAADTRFFNIVLKEE